MKKVVLILWMIPLLASAQSEKGIRFEEGLDWAQVQAKAKASNKYIFVDCFATWCGPCKVMDKNVYPKDSVGDYMNARFISVKVQMDTSRQDNEVIKKWYGDAHTIRGRYKVTAFPTFLFFSPDGRILHKEVGARKADDFLTLTSDATDPKKQFYTLLDHFRRGNLDFELMPSLAWMARALKENDIANAVARDYLDNYIYRLNDKELYTRKNIQFIANFIQDPKEKGFNLFYHDSDRVDKIMDRKGYSQGEVDYLIAREEIDPRIWRDGSPATDAPDWDRIHFIVREKYGSNYADRTVLNAQLRWYSYKKEWPELARYSIEKMEKYGLDTAGAGKLLLNNMMWEVIFLHIHDVAILNKAIGFQAMIVKTYPDFLNGLDTYANLLYKAGRTREAIAWEEKALKLEEDNALRFKRAPAKEYQETLEKMKKGVPTWSQNGWQMKTVQIQTRWAKDVSPENALPEYPRPQMVRGEWQSLNGLWDYAIIDSTADRPDRFEGSILVPYPLESALSGVKKSLLPDQRLWYKRNLALGEKRTDKRYLLHFGAVDYQTVVYVNGKETGRHTGGYQEFTIDITEALKKGDNELLVGVWDPTDKGNNPRGKQALNPQGIMYTPTSGIWQTVWLETVPPVFITSLYMTPVVDSGYLSLTVNVNDKAAGYSIEAFAKGTGSAVEGIIKGNTNGLLQLPVPNAHLWSPGDPFLYDLTVRLLYKGKPVDEVSSYFGMRKIGITKDDHGQERIFLNGQPIFNLGVLDQGYWPDGLYTAPTDAALKFDVETVKSMGFNTIRKHIKIEPARWYYHCDKLGVLVWQDMPYPANLTAEAKTEFERENDANLLQLHNYPSIICWVLFNEGWNRYDQERLTTLMKKRDPSRIIDGHSGENYDRGSPQNPDQKWINSDLTDVHIYPGPGIPPTLPVKASALGEWGGVRVVTPGHQWDPSKGWGYIQSATADFARKYEFMIKHLKLFEEEGLSASIYTQPFDVEIEENGLMTYDREVFKIPVETIKKINSIMFK